MFKTFVVMLLCMAMLIQSAPEANAQNPTDLFTDAGGKVLSSFAGSGGARFVRRSADVQPETPTSPISPFVS